MSRIPQPAITARYLAETTGEGPLPVNKSLRAEDGDGAVILEYVTEGAANVIWSLILKPEPQSKSLDLQTKLLRLRKGTWSGDAAGPSAGEKKPPPFISSADVLEHFAKNVQPLFEPGQLVEQDLVHVDSSLVAQCNSRLDELERLDLRSKERRHWHIKHEETYGLLITSMLPTTTGSVLFHLKPKWLVQSPTAPSNAKRCRTCALAAKRGADPTHVVCPLALCSGDKSLVRAEIEKLTAAGALLYPEQIFGYPQTHGETHKIHTDDNELQKIVRQITDLFLHGGSAFVLLERLRMLQPQYDPKGVVALEPGASTANLAMAMTLRDATMFIKLSADGADVRLGDLDPKSGDSEKKLQQWRRMEEDLITQGWYCGREDEQLRNGASKHISCFLWS